MPAEAKGGQTVSAAIDQVLLDAVEAGVVPNVAAIAADRNGVIYEGAVGYREVGGQDPVSTATHFRIMSMTKMVATAAALQLIERGKLDVTAPVAQYCPEFASIQVLDGFDGDTPRLRPPASQATVHQLLTHTTGLGYWFFNAELVRWHEATGIPNFLAGLNSTFTAPLLTDPGTRYNYGINIDWLGRVVEAITGQTLDVVIKENITGPLGMNETTFMPSDAQQANCTPVHVKGEDGSWISAGEILNPHPEWMAAGHGLYSTPRDYIKFQRALLRGGELDGERILAPETVDMAFTNQIGDLEFPPELLTCDPAATNDFVAGPGWKWGYGLLLNPEDAPGMRRGGSGAWAGLCNTHFWIDRSSGLCASIYSSTLPFAPLDALGMYVGFEQALYASR
jgi:CubicO group peptidase (beta-lactamase class C family)